MLEQPFQAVCGFGIGTSILHHNSDSGTGQTGPRDRRSTVRVGVPGKIGWPAYQALAARLCPTRNTYPALPPTKSTLSNSESSNASLSFASRFPVWQIVALAAVAFYIPAFYCWDDQRYRRLILLLLPEMYISDWVGGDFARFAILDRFPILFAAIAICVLATLAGGVFLSTFRIERFITRLETFLLAIGIGLNLLSLMTLAIGLAGGLQQRWIFGVVAVVIVGIAAARRGDLSKLFFGDNETGTLDQASTVGENTQDSRWLRRVGIGFAIPFAVVILLGSFLPPWHFDVREYHAQVPKEWYQQGSIGVMPHNVYGNMPLGAEMHQLIGMQLINRPDAWWWGTLVGKVVIGIFAILTALAIYALGRRYFSRAAGTVGAYLFLSIPWIGWVSMAGLIESASTFYLTMTIFALARWLELARGEARGLAAVAGFMAGAAVACKYPALLFVVVPGGLILLTSMVWHRDFDWKTITVYSVCVAIGCGLWFGKNWVFTGNPTYPLLYDLFGGSIWTAAKDAQWSAVHGAPINGFTFGFLCRSVELLAIESMFLSPVLVPFAILGLKPGRHRWLTLIAVGTIGFVVVSWWVLTHRIDRFLLPLLPLVALLAGRGATLSDTPFWKRGVTLLLAVALFPNLSLICSRIISDNRFFVSLQDLHDLGAKDVSDSNPHMHITLEFLNLAVQPGYRALMCGEAQVYDLEMPILYNTCFDDCVLEKLFKGKTREERYDALRRNRISHVHIRWFELDRYRSPGNYGYSDYTTRDFVRRELVAEQQLLRDIPLGLEPDNVQIFEVVGWREWAAEWE
jgi:hypothetical protein